MHDQTTQGPQSSSPARVYRQLPEEEATRIAENLREATSLTDAAYLAGLLTAEHPSLTLGLSPLMPFFRARRATSERGFETIAKVLAPPPEKSRVGRLNEKGEPALYVSRQMETAIAELEPEDGDLFHVIAIRPVESIELKLLVVGEHHHVLRVGHLASLGYDPDSVIQKGLIELGYPWNGRVAYVDSLLAEILADPSARDRGYVPQRALLSALAPRGPALDGVLYPSVRHPLGWNYRLNPPRYPDQIKVIASTVVRVERRLRNGYLKLNTTSHHGLPNGPYSLEELPTKRSGVLYYFNVTEEEQRKFIPSGEGCHPGPRD